MSDRCGPGFQRELSGGGKIRALSRHMVEKPHRRITRRIVEDVLDNWLLKGERSDSHGRRSRNYLAYSPELEKVVRVVVSMDDATIVTAFPDGNATRAWNRGDHSYFRRVYDNLEVRDEPAASV